MEDPKTKEWFIVYHRWEGTQKEGPFRGGGKIAVEKVEYDADGGIRPVKMTDGR